MTARPARLAAVPPRGVVDPLAAERAIVSALLADPASTLRALAELGIEAGDLPRFGSVVAAVRRVLERAEPADAATIGAELAAAGELAGLGGISVLLELSEALPDPRPGAVEFYARRLREAALVRRVKGLADDLDGDLGAAGDLETVLGELRAVRDGAIGRRSVLADCWPSEPDASPYLNPALPRAWLLTQPDGQGLLPSGKAGILAAEGGTGKTSALVSLAVSAVTGRSWFKHFTVPAYVNGRVLLLLAEEDTVDAHRRLYGAAEALGLTEREREHCARKIVVVPLAGRSVSLTTMTAGVLTETPLAADLRRRLAEGADGLGWSLVALDPFSRFAGGDIEGSNEAATRFVELLESLTEAPGHPAVLVAAHSSKMARRAGQADVRGVTAITDGARWVATLQREKERVVFSVVKSNYSLPTDPVPLRWEAGVLRVLSPTEQAQAAGAADGGADDDVRRVVVALEREGVLGSKDAIVRAAGMKLSAGRVAVDLAVGRRLILLAGTSRRPEYRVARPEGVCAADPPYPPDVRDVGTSSSGRPGWRPGTSRDVEGRLDVEQANEGGYRPPVEPF